MRDIFFSPIKAKLMKGSCICSSVSFTVSGRTPGMYQCHCTLCQKQSGAGSNAATLVTLEQFEWSGGNEGVTQWRKPSGFNSHFCRQCGCPAPNPVGSKYMWIPMGLVGPTDSKIVAHLCLAFKSDWDIPSKAIRHYQEMPEDIDEFVQFLHSFQTD